ncbi:hypothetical protein ACLOJK_017862 [Asimina triloba]
MSSNSGETAQLKANCCVMVKLSYLGMRCPANSHKPSFHVNTTVTSKHNNVKGTGTGHRGGGMPTTNMDESMTEEEFFEWLLNIVQFVRYISTRDIARVGVHPPNDAAVYQNVFGLFEAPVGYDLVWGNCAEDLLPLNTFDGILSRRKVPSFAEPLPDFAYCINARVAEETIFDDQIVLY